MKSTMHIKKLIKFYPEVFIMVQKAPVRNLWYDSTQTHVKLFGLLCFEFYYNLLAIGPFYTCACVCRYCSKVEGEMRLTTNAVYFVLRGVATMALACCFIMLDAQTIQVQPIFQTIDNIDYPFELYWMART